MSVPRQECSPGRPCANGPQGAAVSSSPLAQQNAGASQTELVVLTTASPLPTGGEGAQESPNANAQVTIVTSVQAPHTTQAVFTGSAVPSLVAEGSDDDDWIGMNNGAVAGIAIGALILGAILSFIATFLLLKKRRSSKPQELQVLQTQRSRAHPPSYATYSDSTPDLVMLQQQKSLGGRNSPYVQISQHTPQPIRTPTPESPRKPAALASFLPPPAHDGDVQARVAALFGLVARHVETYYRNVQASITPSMEPELAKFGAKGVDMATLLSTSSSSATTAIQHALAVYVARATSPHSDDGTVFPAALASCVALGNKSDESDPDLLSAQSLHRRLTAYLYQSNSSKPNSLYPSPSTLREAAEHFSLTFFPWANPAADDDAKEAELAGILAQALDLQVYLLGQPGEWGVRWNGVGMRGVVVVPEIVVEEDDGERVVVEGRVVAV